MPTKSKQYVHKKKPASASGRKRSTPKNKQHVASEGAFDMFYLQFIATDIQHEQSINTGIPFNELFDSTP